MTDCVAFYGAIRQQANGADPAFSFDDLVAGNYFDLVDYTIKQQNMPDLSQVALKASELLDLARFWQHEAQIFGGFQTLRDQFSARFAAVVAGAFAAKKDLGGGNIYIGKQGSIIPQLLRPSTALAAAGAFSAVNTWVPTGNGTKSFQAAYFTINLNNTNSSSQAQALQNLVTVLLLGIADNASVPNIQEVQLTDPSATKYGVYSFPMEKTLDDTAIRLFPEAYNMRKNEQWKVDVNFIATAATIPVLYGVQYAALQVATSEA